ncbi:hypothetical protein [Sorangium sp. So ce341]|uniref:hypothetical protein n=1 Tax=Sorangium sp. So ce341 TaxID=3133302 RepID=UPI003F61A248
MPTLINTALISFMLIDIRRLLSGKGKLSPYIAAPWLDVNTHLAAERACEHQRGADEVRGQKLQSPIEFARTTDADNASGGKLHS